MLIFTCIICVSLDYHYTRFACPLRVKTFSSLLLWIQPSAVSLTLAVFGTEELVVSAVLGANLFSCQKQPRQTRIEILPCTAWSDVVLVLQRFGGSPCLVLVTTRLLATLPPNLTTLTLTGVPLNLPLISRYSPRRACFHWLSLPRREPGCTCHPCSNQQVSRHAPSLCPISRALHMTRGWSSENRVQIRGQGTNWKTCNIQRQRKRRCCGAHETF